MTTSETNPTGERYYAAPTYLLPSDEQERQRLEIQYRTLQKYTQQLLPPGLKLGEGDEVLDAGAGTGIWINDLSARVPISVSLVGIDIEPKLFPPHPPPSHSFHVHSTLSLPPSWSARFALVHQSLMGLAFSAQAWETAVQQFWRVLKPGGWVQLEELDILWTTEHDRPRLPAYSTRALEALRKLCAMKGVEPEMYPLIGGMLEREGFERVGRRVVQVPFREEGGDSNVLKSSVEAWKGMRTAVLKLGGLGLGTTEEEFDGFLEGMAQEWRDNGSAIPYIIWTARKPE